MSDLERNAMRPGCDICKHWRGGFTCDAYPVGIPWPIMAGDVAHVEPLSDDNGIQFEPIDELQEDANG